jgi:hypothetical protein
MLTPSTGTGLRKTVFERLIVPEVIDALPTRGSGFMVEGLYKLDGVQGRGELLRSLPPAS